MHARLRRVLPGDPMVLSRGCHLTTTTTITTLPFPDRGVSLAFLRRFMAENKDRLRHAGAASTAHSSRLPETLTELVQRVNRLRAMPWESTELASVEAKLCAIKLSSVALFREALAKELQGDDFSGVPINKMLRDAGKTTFGAETKRIFAKVLQLEEEKGGPAGVAAASSLPEEDVLTTSEVCAKIVRPDTAGTGGAYVDLLRGRPREVGRATHFVSHTWSYRFTDLVAGVEAFAARELLPAATKEREKDTTTTPGGEKEGRMREEDAFFWIDIFSVDENRAADPANALPQAWWSGTFMDAIAAIGRTVLVLSPWAAPRPCTRCRTSTLATST